MRSTYKQLYYINRGKVKAEDVYKRQDVFGETTFAMAVRACVPGADTFVWF